MAGNPSIRTLESLTKRVGNRYARATISEKLNAKSKPDWEFVKHFLLACAMHAGVPEDQCARAVDMDEWRSAHRQLLRELAGSREGWRRSAEAAAELVLSLPDSGSIEDRTRESELRHRYQAVRMFPSIHTMPGEPTRYFVLVKNASDLPVYNVFPAMHYRLSNSRGTHTFPEHLEQALMPGDTVRLPAEGCFAWEVPSGFEEIWVQIWFRDAELVHWTVTSKGEIVEQNGPPMILGSRGQSPADLQPGHQPRGRRY